MTYQGKFRGRLVVAALAFAAVIASVVGVGGRSGAAVPDDSGAALVALRNLPSGSGEVVAAPDGSFFFTEPGTGNRLTLFRADATGAVVWSTQVGFGSLSEVAVSGNGTVAVSYRSDGSTVNRGRVAQFDSDGQFRWEATIGTPNNDESVWCRELDTRHRRDWGCLLLWQH